MSPHSESTSLVRQAHRAALAMGQSAYEAFEAATAACVKSNPSLSRSQAERLVLGLLRQGDSGRA
jgi:hypothetical protein